MRSRLLRLTFSACSCIAIAAAAAFLFSSEQLLSTRRASVREFDLRARDAATNFGDLKAAQASYVAAGQGIGFWMPKADATKVATASLLSALRESAVSANSFSAMDDAAAALTEFDKIDKRARNYLASGAPLMAADVVFTEGVEVTGQGARAVERARLEERRELDDLEIRRRRLEAQALSGAAALTVLTIALLVAVPTPDERAVSVTAPSTPRDEVPDADITDARPPAAKPVTGPTLGMAAQLCTDLGRMGDPMDLSAVLGQAADVLNASGLVVWVRNSSGAELSPVFAHGYSQETVARLPQIPRSADNAAAVAYRTGALQIVLSRPGSSKGAVAAPLLSTNGCVGVLSAEIRDGGEASDAVQALARILAAQLSGLLGSTASAVDGQRAAL
jgi:hypothetical protein